MEVGGPRRSPFPFENVATAPPTTIHVGLKLALVRLLGIVIREIGSRTADPGTHAMRTDAVALKPPAAAALALRPSNLPQTGEQNPLPAARDALTARLNEDAHQDLNKTLYARRHGG